MNVVWTPTDAARPDHVFAAPVVAENVEGIERGHSAPAGLDGWPERPVSHPVSCVPTEQVVPACSPGGQPGHPCASDAHGGGGGEPGRNAFSPQRPGSPAAHDLTDEHGDLTEHGWSVASDHWEIEPEGDE